MAQAMLQLLEISGFPARHAEHGKAALEAVESQMPALVLLDMLMPVMDGWQCARELRARYGDSLPIVIVTAAEHVQERSKEIGANEVLPKPFELRHLLKIVERYVNGSRRTDH